MENQQEFFQQFLGIVTSKHIRTGTLSPSFQTLQKQKTIIEVNFKQ